MDQIATIVLVMCAGMLVILIGIWFIFFKGSLRRLLVSFAGILVNKDQKIDPAAPIDVPTEAQFSDLMEARAQQIKQTGELEGVPPRPQSARIPPNERGDKARTTSDNGWPSRIYEQIKRIPHGFRFSRLRTESDDYDQPAPDPDDVFNDPPQPDLDAVDMIDKVESSGKSYFGARFRDKNPGRRLRDRRYRRNSD